MTDTFKNPKRMSDTPEEREFELRAHIGSIWSGGRLFIGMYTFLVASLCFSYFYLRSSNNGLLWRPHHVTAPTSIGWAIYSLMLLTTLFAIFGQTRLRKGAVLDWQVAGWTGVGAGLVALLLQIWEFTAVPFYPGSSGYASTFIGYAVINIITISAGTYWLETTLARASRLRTELGGANPMTSMAPTAQSFRANVAAMTYFWGFIALASTLLFAMFYLL
ncbi:MAG TPA: hypothetical protein VNF08_01280 [Acidimicrobiales bacterium]|nr:hypothetical protein [Acidimicrobiales bacterium]